MADVAKLRLEVDPSGARRGALDAAGAFDTLRNRSRLLQGALAALGLGSVALLFRDAVRASMEWETAMTGVAKTVDATTAELAVMGEELRAMSEQIPVAATELAGVAEAAGQLGIQTDAIVGFTRVMADLGVSTNLSSEEAATALARLANVMQTPQDQFDRMGSTIVALGNNLATTERELVEFGTRMAGAGQIAGLTEANVLAIGAALSSVGVEAEAGGTAVQKVLIDMNTAVAESNSALDKFAEVAGMSAAEFAALWEQDAAAGFVAFVEGLARSGDNAAGVLDDLGLANQRLIRAFLSLANAGDLLRESVDLGTEAWRENTALTEEAERFYATLESQLKTLANQAFNTAAEFGAMFGPAITGNIDVASQALDEVAVSLDNIATNMGRVSSELRSITDRLEDFRRNNPVSTWLNDWLASNADIPEMPSSLTGSGYAGGGGPGNLGPVLNPAFLTALSASMREVGEDTARTKREAASLPEPFTLLADSARAASSEVSRLYRLIAERQGRVRGGREGWRPASGLYADPAIGPIASIYGDEGGTRQDSAAALLGTAGRYAPGVGGNLLSSAGGIAAAIGTGGVVGAIGVVGEAFNGLSSILGDSGDAARRFAQELESLNFRFDFLDINDAAEKFRQTMALIEEQFGFDLPDDLSPENFDQYAAMFDQFLSDLRKLEEKIGENRFIGLWGASYDQIAKTFGQLESLGDSARDAASAMRGITDALNAPDGLRISLLEWRASGVLPPPGSPPSVPGHRGGGAGGGRGGVDVPRALNVAAGAITIVQRDGEDAEGLANRVVEALEQKALRGGGDPLTLTVR